MKDNTSESLPSFTVRGCRGRVACRHAVFGHDPVPDIVRAMDASGWDAFLSTQVHPLRHHHQFRLAVSACPNGCSQPHIADFGLIATTQINLDPERCSGCGLCVDACAEKALTLDNCLHLDEAACLGCAACVRVCPTAGLIHGADAYRVLVGGKLGRHPRLAHELGTVTLAEVPRVLERIVAAFMVHRSHRERLGDVIERLGRAYFDRMVWS